MDANGNAYVTGGAGSGFPTTPGAFQPNFAGGFTDTFVIKLNAAGAALNYSTYVGGSDQDGGKAIALDATGNAYITGWAFSTNFPTTPGAFQLTSVSGGPFVTKLNPSGSALVYSSYLAGSTGGGANSGAGIAVDACLLYTSPSPRDS